MSNKITRRSFLTTLGAFGAAASLDSVDWLFADDAPLMPKKTDSLANKPVLTIAHCCDPQFGFGLVKTEEKDAYAHDLDRFERELDLINASKPDVVFFAGDMCHDKNDLKKDWPRLLKA
ncbi:MAG: metallophosphoesterase, partial [Thermoguttaceae bacterium]|nr:metallophosphoesterase [Thermoguttaceae bacterium]